MYFENLKIDVIVPTADASTWPAKDSLAWNAERSRKFPDVHFIPIESSGPNFSFSKSVNRGISMSRSDSDIFLLNDDCFLDFHWVQRLLAAKISHPECGVFGALLRFPDNFDIRSHGNHWSGRNALNHWKPRYQHAGGYIPISFREMLYGIVRFGLWNASPLFELRMGLKTPEAGFRFPGHYHVLKISNRIDLITGAAMFITRSAFERLGHFDEAFPLGFEDTDYSLRSLEMGIRLCLVSDCTGVHYESLTSQHLEERKRSSYRIFYRKWPGNRIKKTILGNPGTIVHPKFCHCGDWVE